MKKEKLSVWGLMARATLPLTLLTCAIVTVIDLVLFPLQSAGAQRMEDAFTDSAVMTVFAIALAVLFETLCLRGALGAKNALPFARLRVSGRAQLAMLAAQIALCLLILWAWQAGVVLGLALWWARLHPEAIGQHTLLLTTYRVSFLHALLPLGDGLQWLRNIVLCASLGLCAAKAALTRRAGWPMVFGAASALLWPTSVGMETFLVVQTVVLALAGWIAWATGKGALRDAET